MSKLTETNEKIVEGVTEGYKKIESGVVASLVLGMGMCLIPMSLGLK